MSKRFVLFKIAVDPTEIPEDLIESSPERKYGME